jgi:hypothetical protein
MFRYEIRIPARMQLQDIMEEIASEAWIILNHRFEEEELAGQYKKFKNQVRRTMTPYLERFYLCGTSDICTDEARKVFGDHKSDWSSPGPETRIYHLMLPGTLKEFLDELTSKALKSTKNLINEKGHQKARAALTLAFRSAMGKYLYYNPWCGKAQICRYSFPIDPWINYEVVEDPELSR